MELNVDGKEVGGSCIKKEERATEGAKAMSEYKAEGEAERAKTARLKAQRLAKEAAGDVAKQPKRVTLSPDDPLAKPRKRHPAERSRRNDFRNPRVTRTAGLPLDPAAHSDFSPTPMGLFSNERVPVGNPTDSFFELCKHLAFGWR